MTPIKSLNELIDSLKNSDAKDFVKIAKNMQLPISGFEKYIHFKEGGYARNCIIKTVEFELILICWKKGDITPVHGHNDQKCWVYQVDGEMTEVRYQQDADGNLTECNRMSLTPGKLCYMHDSMGYHSLENTSSENSITLHLYNKPVSCCDVYNSEEECFENKELSFDTVDGNSVASSKALLI